MLHVVMYMCVCVHVRGLLITRCSNVAEYIPGKSRPKSLDVVVVCQLHTHAYLLLWHMHLPKHILLQGTGKLAEYCWHLGP